MLDPTEPRMVTIPAWVDEAGELRFFYGGPLPSLAPGTIVDLSLPEANMSSDFYRELLAARKRMTLLKSGALLLAEVRLQGVPDEALIESRSVMPGLFTSDSRLAGVVVELDEDLDLEVSLGKSSQLMDCRCRIPALNHTEGRSLNHAYTLISQQFEPSRRSHTGNVFEKVHVWNPDASKHYPLRDARDHELRQMEEDFMRECDPWWYCAVRGEWWNTWAILEAPGNDDATIHLMQQYSEPSGRDFVLKTEIVGTIGPTSHDSALHWLRTKGYEHLPDTDYPALEAPQPPYYSRDGKKAQKLNWSDRSVYLQRMTAYFDSRRKQRLRPSGRMVQNQE